MTTPDQTRIEADRAHPRILDLWRALQPLKTVVRFMQTGAHPDDEKSGMLAALAFRDGINLSYACSTRGEGGQNDIGRESGAALGALRTLEMHRACDVLGMRMYWHSVSPDDPITDFGFSKSGVETLGKWGHDRTLARFVEIVRTEKPDIICPTFLDVPGQHGHHRAMTQAAHEVMAAAADPAFRSNLPVWQVKKLYLPAMSGAGQAYDDAEPPPPVTLTIDGAGAEWVSGWSWERIGQQSRAYHRTQGMGRWVPAGDGADWPLHLAESHVEGPDDALTSGLVTTLGDWARVAGAEPIAEALLTADAAITAALNAFPAYDAVAQAGVRALTAVRKAMADCPADLAPDLMHRLGAKDVQLGHVLRLALGVEARARVSDLFLRPGAQTALTVEAHGAEVAFDLPRGWRVDRDRLLIAADAAPSDAYPDVYDPASANAPALRVSFAAGDETIDLTLPFEAAPVILPPVAAEVSPSKAVLTLSNGTREVDVKATGVVPAGAEVSLVPPEGWQVQPRDGSLTVAAPEDVTAGLYDLPVKVGGQPAFSTQQIAYSHTGATALSVPATVRLRVLDVTLPEVRVGYIGAGNDRVDHWLAAMGVDVTALADTEMADPAALARFDTLVIGIFAMRFRAGLVAAMPAIHRWCEAGGTLVTLYHRPWDNWDPDTIPPKRLEIGQPSLRWRVTDETAQVTHLSDHDLLTTPNTIGPADWDGWVKERGLYFAKSWDDAYQPLLEMADPEEDPHRGSLLVADIGRGRHIHTSLILHHQMENLVPGAFRLMANLIAKRK